MHARERRQQRGVGVDVAVRRTRPGTPAPTSFMKPAETTRSGCVRATYAVSAASQSVPGRERRSPRARTSGCRRARPGPAPRCRRGRRPRRPPARRTTGRRRRRGGPAGCCPTGHEHDQTRGSGVGTRAVLRQSPSRRPRRSQRGPAPCHHVVTSAPTRPPMAKAGSGVHEHVEGVDADVAHPARTDRPPGQRRQHRDEDSPRACPPRQPRTAAWSQRSVGRARWVRTVATDGDQDRGRHEVRRPGRRRSAVGQCREQREQRQRSEDDGRRRHEGAGADGEARAEEVGAGEQRGVGHDRQGQRDEHDRSAVPRCSWEMTLGAEAPSTASDTSHTSSDTSRKWLRMRRAVTQRVAGDLGDEGRPDRQPPGAERDRRPGDQQRQGDRPQHRARARTGRCGRCRRARG